jgi:hypothetical protein
MTTEPTLTPQGLAALTYAERGWPVLPLHAPREGGCSCGKADCSSIGKHPRTANGLLEASTDTATVTKWWTDWPEANVGLRSGVWADMLDLDSLSAVAFFEDTVKGHGGNPQTLPAVFTNKGLHFYFAPTGSRNLAGFRPGWDWRGTNGYVVAPPSLHASGHLYQWRCGVNGTVPPAPGWLLQLMQERPRTTLTPGEPITEGQRNAALASLAGVMRRKGMGSVAIEAALLEENRTRCRPALGDAEVRQIAQSVGRYQPALATPPAPVIPSIRICDVAETPPAPDIIEGVFPARFPSSLYGAGGNLKSYIGLYALLCITSGQRFLGRQVTRAPAMFVDWELDADTTARRARQLARGLGLPGVPDTLRYLNATRPLLELVGQLENEIADHGLQVLVLDSLGLAIAADTKTEEAILPAMGALRDLHVATVLIDHQSRIQTDQSYGDKEQYGSVYKGNLARGIWQLERADPGTDPAVVDLVLRNKKTTFGLLGEHLGLRVTFGARGVKVDAIDAASSPSLAGKLPAKDRVLAALTAEPGITVDDLAEFTGISAKTAQNVLAQLRAGGQATANRDSRRTPYKWYPSPSVPSVGTLSIPTEALSVPRGTPPLGGVYPGRDTEVDRVEEAIGTLGTQTGTLKDGDDPEGGLL